jgi:hypothetical protein
MTRKHRQRADPARVRAQLVSLRLSCGSVGSSVGSSMAAGVERNRMWATHPEFSAILRGANIHDGNGSVSSAVIGNAQTLLAAVRLRRGNDWLVGGAAAAIAGACQCRGAHQERECRYDRKALDVPLLPQRRIGPELCYQLRRGGAVIAITKRSIWANFPAHHRGRAFSFFIVGTVG